MLNVVVIFAVVLLSSLVGYICYLSRSKHNVMLTTDGELVAVGADAADKNASLDGKGDEFGFDYSSAVAAYEKAKKDFQALPDDQRESSKKPLEVALVKRGMVVVERIMLLQEAEKDINAAARANLVLPARLRSFRLAVDAAGTELAAVRAEAAEQFDKPGQEPFDVVKKAAYFVHLRRAEEAKKAAARDAERKEQEEKRQRERAERERAERERAEAERKRKEAERAFKELMDAEEQRQRRKAGAGATGAGDGSDAGAGSGSTKGGKKKHA